MNLRSLFAVAAIAAASLPAHAVTVVGWDFENAVTGASTVAASTGTGTALGFHAGTTTYSTPVGNGSAKSFSSNGWAVNDYYQFNFSTLGFSSVALTFDQLGSSTGPKDFSLQYSTDGVNFTTLTSYAVTTATWSANTPLASGATSYSYSVGALNNLSSVSVRLLNTTAISIGGATVGSGGTDRVDNFTVSGTVAAVPEPGTYAMLLAGLGVVGFIGKRRKV